MAPLSSLMMVVLHTCQPIVFVSDRARANKEIEHDGIQGERRKKPKVKEFWYFNASMCTGKTSFEHKKYGING